MEILPKLIKKQRLINEKTNDGLETFEEYQQRWTSVRIIYFTMMINGLGLSIVLTGIWPYLDKTDSSAGKVFMGYIVAANPLGQMLFSPLIGYWGNRVGSIRIPMLTSLVLFVLSSTVYSSLEIFSTHVKWWMLGARFFVGVSTANMAVCRSYLSAATTLKERTGAISIASFAQSLGFVIGPALQAGITSLGEDGFVIIKGIITLNMYTTSSWINVILGIINFCMFLPAIFKEKRIATREAMILQGKESEKETWESTHPDYVTVWTLIVAFFVLVFNYALLETLATSLTMDQFAWSRSEALYYMGILMSIGGVIACATFLAVGTLSKKFKEKRLLIWGGLFLMVIGRAVDIPWGDTPPKMAEIITHNKTMHMLDNNLNLTGFSYNLTNINYMHDNKTESQELVGCPVSQEWCRTARSMTLTQFIFGYILSCIGYPIGFTLIQTIYSKILGPRPQGVWMGILIGSACLSRVVSPVCVGYIYTKYGTNWTFGTATVMMIIPMIWLMCVRQRLTPPNYESPIAELQKPNKNRVKSNELSILEEKHKLTHGAA